MIKVKNLVIIVLILCTINVFGESSEKSLAGILQNNSEKLNSALAIRVRRNGSPLRFSRRNREILKAGSDVDWDVAADSIVLSAAKLSTISPNEIAPFLNKISNTNGAYAGDFMNYLNRHGVKNIANPRLFALALASSMTLTSFVLLDEFDKKLKEENIELEEIQNLEDILTFYITGNMPCERQAAILNISSGGVSELVKDLSCITHFNLHLFSLIGHERNSDASLAMLEVFLSNNMKSLTSLDYSYKAANFIKGYLKVNKEHSKAAEAILKQIKKIMPRDLSRVTNGQVIDIKDFLGQLNNNTDEVEALKQEILSTLKNVNR